MLGRLSEKNLLDGNEREREKVRIKEMKIILMIVFEVWNRRNSIIMENYSNIP